MRRALAGLAVGIAGLLTVVPSALANAPNPIPGTTQLVSMSVSPSGARTVTIEGQWNWVTQTNCPTSRDGVGYQVAWFDGNTANAIGQNNSPDGVIHVGDATDNIVHSLDNLDPSNTDLTYNGVPASYLAHDTTSRAPTNTDAKSWVSNCNNEDPTTKISSGTWGPISHTYPASYTGPIRVCPVMYDPHGSGTAAGGNIGSSGVGDITAGGGGHNGDNSYEGNGTGANGNNCLITSFPAISTIASGAVEAGGQITDTATLSGGSSPTGTISFELYRTSDTTCSSPVAGPLTATVNGNGSYTSPTITESTPGTYQWVATYSGDANNSAVSEGCNGSDESVLVTPPGTPPAPGMVVTKEQELANNPTGYTTAVLTASVGEVVDYKMSVTNTGAVELTLNFSDPRCDPGTLIGPVGTLNADGSLAPGRTVDYYCSHVITAADAANGSFTNTVTVIGTPPSGPPVGPISKSVTTDIGRVKAACTLAASAIRLTGVSGIERKSFVASVSSSAIKQAVFYLDGRKVATVNRPTHGKFSVRINTAALSIGAHHLTVKLKFTEALCPGASRKAAFVKPKPPVVIPVFTG